MNMSFSEIIMKVARDAGLKTIKVDDTYVKCAFGLSAGRSQTVHMVMIGKLGNFTVARIYTPVLEFPGGEIPARVSEGLLRENRNMKVGSFCLEEISGHKILTLHHNMVVETLDPEEFMIVVGSLATTGDRWEHELGGGDRF
jgi:hypothetical protein